MGKTSNFLIGAAVGVVTALVVNYVFGPSNETTYDEHYQSRLDKALTDGKRAADEREAELRRQFEEGKRGRRAPGY
jgi:uncharacterized membrane protein YgaE (UPF0421/DUF939 family)